MVDKKKKKGEKRLGRISQKEKEKAQSQLKMGTGDKNGGL